MTKQADTNALAISDLSVDQSVNVLWSDGETYPATIVKVLKTRVRVRADDDDEELTVAPSKVTLRKSGRQPKTPEQIASEVDDLLAQLDAADTRDERVRIRRLLRSRGHYGGLGAAKTLEEHIAERKAAINQAG